MKKNIVLLLLTVLVVQFCICSCTYYTDDPFLTDTDTQTGADTGVNTIIETETEAKKEGPDEDFYTLTLKQSYEKYGCSTISISQLEEYTDGTWFYTGMSVGSSEDIYLTMGRTRYPVGSEKAEVICRDPLCKHTADSGCPFANCSVANIAFYADHLYYMTNIGELCVYDFDTNKKTVLLEDCLTSRFYKNDGNLYFQYNYEDDDNLIYEKVFVKISQDGKLTELGRIEGGDAKFSYVYEDRYVIQNVCLRDEKKVLINSYDLRTKEDKTVCEFDYIDAAGMSNSDFVMIYGSKVLFETKYYKKSKVGLYNTDCYLVDITNGEKEFICSPDYETYHTLSAFCLHSSKCISWFDPRESEDDPFIVHIYFPISGDRETYDLSKMAASIGEVIPMESYFSNLEKGAITLKKRLDPNSSSSAIINTFEFDLASGRVYKYDVPAA